MIRGLSNETLAKLSDQANSRGVSREELVRTILENFALAPALLEQEEKYQNLIKTLSEILECHTTTIKNLEETVDTLAGCIRTIFVRQKEGLEQV